MGIEDRLNRLEEENAALKDRIAYLEAVGLDEFLPPKAIAAKMHCSKSTVLNYIKSGRIQATRKLGDWRIPTSQFYREDSETVITDVESESMIRPQKKRGPEKEATMKDIVFGGQGGYRCVTTLQATVPATGTACSTKRTRAGGVTGQWRRPRPW